MVRSGGLLVAVVGDVDAADVAAAVARLDLGAPPQLPVLPPLRWDGGHRGIERESSDQVHVRLAFPAVAASHPAAVAFTILNRILGVGASSRLFQRLREEEGLTYDIWSGLVLRSVGGLLEIGWACAPAAHDEVWRLVNHELREASLQITDDEVAVAREGLVRSLDMDAESLPGLCSLEVAETLNRGRRFDRDAAVAELEAVTPDEVRAQARTTLRQDLVATAVCGPPDVVTTRVA
jgi:predicted Zn-dependent peptidase